MAIDEPRGHELASGVDAPIDGRVEGVSDVDHAVTLEHDAAVRQQLVSSAVESDHPATLDQRSHRRLLDLAHDRRAASRGDRMLGGTRSRVNHDQATIAGSTRMTT
jgi:hypothetical protein